MKTGLYVCILRDEPFQEGQVCYFEKDPDPIHWDELQLFTATDSVLTRLIRRRGKAPVVEDQK